MDRTELGYAFAWYFVFIVAATVHEAAHAWAAKRGGDLTAYAGGQVSLNPWPHIKRAPVGMVIIPIISIFLIKWPFGFAVTPYDPVWAYKNPRKAAWMAAAGPVANLALLFLTWVIIEIGLNTGFFLQPVSMSARLLVDPASGGILNGLATFMSMMFTMNLILFILNIIPLPPLDGSGIIALFLKDEPARKYKQVIAHPAFGLIGLLFVWQGFAPIFQIIFVKILSLIYWGQTFYYSGIPLFKMFFS